MIEVLFLVTLPSGVQLDEDVLRGRWVVGGLEGSGWLRLPQVPSEVVDFKHLDAPDSFTVDDAGVPPGWPTGTWGTVFNVTTRSHHRLTELHRFAVSTTYSGLDNEAARRRFAEEARVGVQAWTMRLCRWLQVTARTVFGDPGTAADPLQVSVFSTAVTPSDSGVRTFEPLSQTIQIGPIHVWTGAITTTQWALAVARANQAVEPPLCHRYLHDARLAWRRADYRRAVVDSATACELALSSSIRELRADLKDKEIEAIFRSFDGVAGLYDYRDALARVPSVSRGRLVGQLAGLRNGVVHEGQPVSESDAAAALGVADDLIAAVASLAEGEP